MSPRHAGETRSFVGPFAGIIVYAGAAACLVVAAAMLPFNAYILNILMQAATYAVAVFGLTIVLGMCGQINLAQAAFFGLGAYSVALGTTGGELSYWVALAIGIVAASVAGVGLGLSTLRLGGHYLAMVTISFQQIVTLILNNWIEVTNGPDGVRNVGRPALFSTGNGYLAFAVAVLAIVGYFVWTLKAKQLGRAMRAVRDNELAAAVFGINVYRTKVIGFALSAALGGLGGGLFAGGFGYVSPDQFSFGESIVFMTMALLGGASTPAGAAIGTCLLVLLPEWLRFLRNIYLAIYGLAVILIVIFMPDGIWGWINAWFSQLRPRPSPGGTVQPLALPPAAHAGSDVVLEVRALAKHFGGLKAVDQVDLSVQRNAVHALIGPNGSGKTTLLNVLSGLYRPTAGQIMLAGRDITASPPHARAAAGLGRTFQNIRLFRSMTVIENVVIGAERPNNKIGPGTEALVERALAALAFVGLQQRAQDPVTTLSYGHQRLVEIARALAGNPAVLLLDEPAAGLNLSEKQQLVTLLARLKGHGLTILIVDHDMNLVEQVADRITVLNFGRRIADGAPDHVLSHPDVVAAYLGDDRLAA